MGVAWVTPTARGRLSLGQRQRTGGELEASRPQHWVSGEVIARAFGPDGRRVEIGSRQWRHVLEEHAEMVGYLEQTVKTIEYPDHREADLALGRERYFRRGGPQRWIRAVVEFAGETDQLITAFPQRNDPPGWRGEWR